MFKMFVTVDKQQCFKSFISQAISIKLEQVACKRQSFVNSGAWLQRFDNATGVVKTDFFH